MYALVYERALQRYMKGDLRDAVIDAYTAFEMYVATVPVRARYDLDRNLPPKDIPRLRRELKPCTSNAASALAAALATISLLARHAPPKVNPKIARIRNLAVHAGEYPSVDDAERVLFEVEELVVRFDDVLDGAAEGREPHFHLACGIVDRVPSEGDIDGAMSVGICAVLSGQTKPRETARARLDRYRRGELYSVQLY